jgi:hypothetical protein
MYLANATNRRKPSSDCLQNKEYKDAANFTTDCWVVIKRPISFVRKVVKLTTELKKATYHILDSVKKKVTYCQKAK